MGLRSRSNASAALGRPLLALCCLLRTDPSALADSSQPGGETCAPETWELEARPLMRPQAVHGQADATGYDVSKYTIRYDVNFTNRTVRGDVTIDATSRKDGLRTIDLDFHGFAISAVAVDGKAAAYQRVSDGYVLRVRLGKSLPRTRAFSVRVRYSGTPRPSRDGLGFGFTSRGAATFAEPDGAREWFPCKDRPSDKAEYEGFITVPSSMIVASNGALAGTTVSGKYTTYNWKESHPIATYLISLAIANYRIIEDSLGALPLRHYAYPDLEAAARQDFSRTPAMIDAFQTRLGVPFPFDKYGHALFDNFGGAMEHQSCTSYGTGLITGDNSLDVVVAHELGHQWFGDFVSPASWKEIWLNEGFATWTEFLWIESAAPGSLRDYMEQAEDSYMSYEARAGKYALYAPPWQYLFGTTIYEKGGWVVSMLRYLLGDEAFFRGLNDYLEAHAYRNVKTTDLRAALEAASGRDLSTFFDQWVYGVGYPIYAVSWTSTAVTGGYDVAVRIHQIQTGTPVFTIPLEVEARATGSTPDRRRVEITSADTTIHLTFAFQPSSVVIDPDNKVLGIVSGQ